MIIDSGQAMVNLTDIYTLNETAAFIWKNAGDGEIDLLRLASLVCETYQIDEATAKGDVERQLKEWQTYGLLTE